MIWSWLISLGLAQEVSLHVQQNKLYSGLPFVLTVLATDFEEEPVPEVADFQIDGCEVQFLGVDPQISRQMTIINGQFSESKEVKYAYRYRVLAGKKGSYEVPPISVTQDSTARTTSPSRFTVQEVPNTADMEIHLSFEEGQYWVGQEIPVFVDLYLRKDIAEQEISVPMFDLFPTRAAFSEARSLGLLTTFGEVQLPISQEKITWKGKPTTRIRLSGIVELNQAGNFEIEPAKIFAEVAVRQVKRAFGRTRNQYAFFQSVDRPKKLVVKPLPLQSRPPAFSGGVGEGFSLVVSASRTVVGVGEPISLEFVLRGDGKLDGIQLPSLEEMGLDPRIFSLPSTDVIGMKQDDGSKKYAVNIQLKTTAAREIPALTFPFFNPKLGKYQIARSEPIALSVRETEKISSTDVFSAREKNSSTDIPTTENRPVVTENTGIDLSLSPPEKSLRATLSQQTAGWLLAAGHFLGLLWLAFSRWWARGREARETKVEKNAILLRLNHAIQASEERPAAQSARELGAAIRDWERESQIDCRDELARIEIESFAPEAGVTPLSSSILRSLEEKMKTAGKYLFLFVLGLGMVNESAAERPSVQSVQQEYHQALTIDDRNERTQAFSVLLPQLYQLAQENPQSPEILADWGNTALGASELGIAAFAYHQALEHNPRLGRARQNRQWIEAQLPAWAQSTALSDPLLWGEWFSLVERMFLMLTSFLLLCSTIHFRRFNLAIPLIFLWASLGLSIGVSQLQPANAFVYKPDAILRAADSSGAPAVRNREIPPGTKVQIMKSQGNWTQIQLYSGEKGWLPKAKLLHSL